MRSAVLLAALALSAPAHAFNQWEALEAAHDLLPACLVGEYGDGQPVTAEDKEDACRRLVEVQQELSENGFCYANGEWAPCK
jgi:hypothetical protein